MAGLSASLASLLGLGEGAASSGALGAIGTAGPWALLGALAFLIGGKFDENYSNTIDSKNRDKITHYLTGNSDNLFPDNLDMFTDGQDAANWISAFGAADPLTTGIASGIANGIGTGDFWQGLAKGASNLLTGGISGIIDAVQNYERKRELDKIRNSIDLTSGSALTKSEIEALLDAYTSNDGLWIFNRDNLDEDSFIEAYKKYQDAVSELGEAPEMYSSDELLDIAQQAESEIDKEVAGLESLYAQSNATINSMYDSALQRQSDMLNREMDYNNQAYSDIINQQLTNQAMAQQSIAGSTRYELDRQQRNAISRGASAAIKLVGNINTQLGLQNKSAQQALETSNNLAQLMLQQRQAGANLRQNYLDAVNNNTYAKASQLNNYTSQRAGLRNGLTERRRAYGIDSMTTADNLRDRDRNVWSDKVSNYFADYPEAEGVYRSRHGGSAL